MIITMIVIIIVIINILNDNYHLESLIHAN